MRCDEHLWYMHHTTAFDPKQKYATDRYQDEVVLRPSA